MPQTQLDTGVLNYHVFGQGAEHIAVMPGESFGQSAAGHVRVAMTLEDSRFEAALRTLCAFAAGLAQAA